MRLWLAAGLVCAMLAVDSTAVSSLGISDGERPERTHMNSAESAPSPRPLILLVTGHGETVGGVALTAR